MFLYSKANCFYPYFSFSFYTVFCFMLLKKERGRGWTIEMLLKQGEFTSRSKNFFEREAPFRLY
jgi:hypothetical protein